MKKMLAACGIALLAATAANAASADDPTIQPRAAATATHIWNVKDVMGATVKNTAGETIGSVNGVLVDENAKLTSVIVGVGGFLGLGEHNVALKVSDVIFSRDDRGNMTLIAQTTKETLKGMPEWVDPNKPKALTTPTIPNQRNSQ
jgi:PRC-barrel domain